MKVIAVQSSGDQTSVSIINNDDILCYSLDHERKDRPDWNKMLSNLGLNSSFLLQTSTSLHMPTAQGLTQQPEVLQVTSKEFVWHWIGRLWRLVQTT